MWVGAGNALLQGLALVGVPMGLSLLSKFRVFGEPPTAVTDGCAMAATHAITHPSSQYKHRGLEESNREGFAAPEGNRLAHQRRARVSGMRNNGVRYLLTSPRPLVREGQHQPNAR